ncbi:MAG: hypothetical protein V1778_00470 [bacterium]
MSAVHVLYALPTTLSFMVLIALVTGITLKRYGESAVFSHDAAEFRGVVYLVAAMINADVSRGICEQYHHEVTNTLLYLVVVGSITFILFVCTVHLTGWLYFKKHRASKV